MDGRRNLKFKISNLKFGLALSLAMLWASFCQAQTGPYVQPMQYRHYSFPNQVNIGAGQLKITNPSAVLELGDSLNSKKSLLLPRGYTDSISSPARGLIIYDLRGQKIKWYNGSSWDSSGSSGGPGGPFMELADTASMLLNYRHWLANYQTKANLSTNVLLGASNTLYPSQLAVKTYVDNQLAGIGSGTFVPNSRLLLAGPWINTLGDLSTNRTIGIDTASLFNQTTGALRRKDSLTSTNLKGYVTRKILGDSMAIWRAGSGILGQPTITYGILATTLDFPRTGLSTLALDFIGGQPTASSNIPFYNGANLAWNSGLAVRASNIITSGADTLASRAWVRSIILAMGGGSAPTLSSVLTAGNSAPLSNMIVGGATMALGTMHYGDYVSGVSTPDGVNIYGTLYMKDDFHLWFKNHLDEDFDLTGGGGSSYTDADAITAPLTGFTLPTPAAVLSSDDILTAIEKLQAQIDDPVYVNEEDFIGDFTSSTPLTLNPNRFRVLDLTGFENGVIDDLYVTVDGGDTVIKVREATTGSGILGADSTRFFVSDTSIRVYLGGTYYVFKQNGGSSGPIGDEPPGIYDAQFTIVDHITESPDNSWIASAGGDDENYGNKGLASQSLPAGAPSRIYFTGTSHGAIYGFSATHALTDWSASTMNAGFLISNTLDIYLINNGVLSSVIGLADADYGYGIYINADGSVIKLQYTTDGTTWSDVSGGGFSTTALSGRRYVVTDIRMNTVTPSDAGVLVNPKIQVLP